METIYLLGTNVKFKKWDIPAGLATVIAAFITMVGGFVAYFHNGRTTSDTPNPVIEETNATLDEDKLRFALDELRVNLGAARIVLFKLDRPISRATATQDMVRNGLRLVMGVALIHTPQAPVQYLPISMNLLDIFDREDLDKKIFEPFEEWPNRFDMKKGSLLYAYMTNQGLMAVIAHHLKNSSGQVVGILDAQYTGPHKFTDVDRDLLIFAGRRLGLMLPWLNGQ